MIIRENKIIDQFLTQKHQQIWLPFWKLLAFNVIITARWLLQDEAKLLANHSALFSIIIKVIRLNSIKVRFCFWRRRISQNLDLFAFFESISILVAHLSFFFPTEFCWANFPILKKKGILSGKNSRSGGGEIGNGFFPKCLAGLVRLSYWGICTKTYPS